MYRPGRVPQAPATVAALGYRRRWLDVQRPRGLKPPRPTHRGLLPHPIMMLETPEFAALAGIVLAAALLYSSGGHAGASAYLAAMALFGVAPESMKPTALALNIMVATIGTIRFAYARAVPWRTLAPLLAGSIPMAFAGGALRLSPGAYVLVLGVTLLVASVFLWLPPRSSDLREPPHRGWLVLVGATLGFVAGMTGIGGGIFLSPLLILARWEEPRRTGGAAAVFILLNSIVGLLGHASSTRFIPPEAAVLGGFAIVGGLVGSWLGVHKLRPLALRRIHAVVLVVSGLKLVLEGLGI